MNKIIPIIGSILFGLMTIVIMCAISSLFLKLLWNDVMTVLFGFKELSLIQAFEIMLITSLMFKSTK